MNYFNFEAEFLNNLKSQSKNCISVIEKNEKLIYEYLNDKTDNKTLKNFIDKFNEIILNNDNNDFKLLKKILHHQIFKSVKAEFRKSDILLRACKNENIKLINWLLTMKINLSVQDDQGMTALMYASKNPELLSILKYILSIKEDESFCLVDKNGENAFFHAVNNSKGLELLLESKKMGEKVNQLNNNNDSVLTYCCRNRIYEPIIPLIRNAYVDPNIFNNEEMTAFMYLVKDGRYEEISFLKKWKTNFNYINSRNESGISLLIHQYYKYYQENNIEVLINYIKVLRFLIETDCSFNTIIDEEGNTAFMFFLWLQDWNTIVYLLLCHKDLDFQKRNINGVNATLLCGMLKENEASEASKINIPNLTKLCVKRTEFDTNAKYNDYDISMFFVIHNCWESVNYLFSKNIELINQVNDKMETPLIVASKLGNIDIIKNILLNYIREVNLDHQDELGNTALHYALELGDKYIINNLAYHHANIHLKNNEGKSPLEIVKSSENNELMNLLKNPVKPYEISNDNDKEEKIIINNGDIIISKCNLYKKEYENYIKITSKFYEITNNIDLISVLQMYEISVYPLYGEIGDIQYYNHEIWKENIGFIIIDDKTKKNKVEIRNAVLSVANALGGGLTGGI